MDWLYQSTYRDAGGTYSRLDELLQSPMHLEILNEVRIDFSNEIIQNLISDDSDWEELQTAINIYLSE